ncbi:hypothetical protein AMTRI_Chr04g189800 [Amborella trichopoda]
MEMDPTSSVHQHPKTVSSLEPDEEAQQHQEIHYAKGTTFSKTCFNMLNALSGVGVVVIPYGLSQGGWAGLGFLGLLAIISYYTCLLLQRCMNMDPHIKCYPDIGNLAFGPKGKIIISTFIYLQLFLLDISFLILVGDSLAKLYPEFGYKIGARRLDGSKAFIILSAIVVLPIAWLKSLRRLAYVSAIGAFACAVVIGAVIWVGLFGGVGFHDKGSFINLSGIPMATSIFALCFNGHAGLPTVIGAMKDRSMGPKALAISFITCSTAYALMSVLSYLMFGDQIKSQITQNLPIKNISSKIAIYVAAILPLLKYALVMAPVVAAIEESFSLCRKRVVNLLLRTTMVALTVIIALTFPFFGDMMAFIGSFLGGTVALILPCICYLKIFKGTKSCMVEKAMVMGILMLGFCMATIGTYFSLKRMLQKM